MSPKQRECTDCNHPATVTVHQSYGRDEPMCDACAQWWVNHDPNARLT